MKNRQQLPADIRLLEQARRVLLRRDKGKAAYVLAGVLDELEARLSLADRL